MNALTHSGAMYQSTLLRQEMSRCPQCGVYIQLLIMLINVTKVILFATEDLITVKYANYFASWRSGFHCTKGVVTLAKQGLHSCVKSFSDIDVF